MNTSKEYYSGFEIGPIRPPSEAQSLLLRITRNCPWNKCRFCRLYKNESFSVRPTEHVLRDISTLKRFIDELEQAEKISLSEKRIVMQRLSEQDYLACQSAEMWRMNGKKSVFLQDANSMIIKSDDMVTILNALRENFPDIERITTYARSHTIARIKDEDLKRIADAGLNRIHIGMESACDKILDLVEKGVDKATHITAGKKVKQAGIELSEYFMPGLGGNEYWRENAIDTADALNQINPDFIRIRTLAVPNNSLLSEDYKKGTFTRVNDERAVEELLLFVNELKGIDSTIKSDHILNLIPEFEGKLPEDKQKMIEALEWFLNLDQSERNIFKIGRRTGIMNSIRHLDIDSKRTRVIELINSNSINNDNIDTVVEELMKNFI
ncbi:MAG TPA: radical SAM protein [Clostridiales bacterium]|nr:radical SAM protein [Clostridiales bacterium]